MSGGFNHTIHLPAPRLAHLPTSRGNCYKTHYNHPTITYLQRCTPLTCVVEACTPTVNTHDSHSSRVRSPNSLQTDTTAPPRQQDRGGGHFIITASSLLRGLSRCGVNEVWYGGILPYVRPSRMKPSWNCTIFALYLAWERFGQHVLSTLFVSLFENSHSDQKQEF